MNFYNVTSQNYDTLLNSINRELWKVAHKILKIEDEEIQYSFTCSEKIHDMTKNKVIVNLCCGEDFIGLILLKKGWAKYIYQIDKKFKKEDDGRYLLKEAAKILNVDTKCTQIIANCYKIEELLPFINLKCDYIMAIHACGSLTDVAIQIACLRSKNVIFAPCCHEHIYDTKMKLIYTRFGRKFTDYYRLGNLARYGYNIRARMKVLHKGKYVQIKRFYIANIPFRRRKTRNIIIFKEFSDRFKEISEKEDTSFDSIKKILIEKNMLI